MLSRPNLFSGVLTTVSRCIYIRHGGAKLLVDTNISFSAQLRGHGTIDCAQERRGAWLHTGCGDDEIAPDRLVEKRKVTASFEARSL
jgi:hypothetical protein